MHMLLLPAIASPTDMRARGKFGAAWTMGLRRIQYLAGTLAATHGMVSELSLGARRFFVCVSGAHDS